MKRRGKPSSGCARRVEKTGDFHTMCWCRRAGMLDGQPCWFAVGSLERHGVDDGALTGPVLSHQHLVLSPLLVGITTVQPVSLSRTVSPTPAPCTLPAAASSFLTPAHDACLCQLWLPLAWAAAVAIAIPVPTLRSRIQLSHGCRDDGPALQMRPQVSVTQGPWWFPMPRLWSSAPASPWPPYSTKTATPAGIPGTRTLGLRSRSWLLPIGMMSPGPPRAQWVSPAGHVHQALSMQPPGTSGCFQLWTVVNDAAVNVGVSGTVHKVRGKWN